MTSDHWRTRVKGGVLRREFLRYAGRVIGWVVTVGSGALASDFLAARRKSAPVKRQVFFEMDGRWHRVGENRLIRVDVGPPVERGSAPPKIA